LTLCNCEKHKNDNKKMKREIKFRVWDGNKMILPDDGICGFAVDDLRNDF